MSWSCQLLHNGPADAWSTLPLLHKAFLWLWRSSSSHSLAGVTHQAQSHTCSSPHTEDGYSQFYSSQTTAGRENKHRRHWMPPPSVSFQPSRCPLSYHQHEYHPHSPFLNSVVGTIIFAVWWPRGCQSLPVSVTSGRKVNTVVSIHWKKDFGGSVAIFPTVTFDWKF